MRPSQTRPVWQEVDLDVLARNMRNIRSLTDDGAEICAVVKADAYGHGALEVAPVLLENGADRLAVATYSEGVQLRRAGIGCPIMMLGYTPADQYPGVITHRLEPTICTLEQAEILSACAVGAGANVPIHIKLDTGMGRIGFALDEESLDEIATAVALPGIEPEGIFTHLSSADEADLAYTDLQIERYDAACQALEARGVHPRVHHICNSAGIMNRKRAHHDMVRAGIILYGDYPSDQVDRAIVDVAEAMTLKAQVSHVKTIQPDDAVSYGRTFIAKRPTRVATLPIGYADGYYRTLSNRAQVLIAGRRAPIIGNICMDQCMIDVTDLDVEVKIGDEAVLIGAQGDQRITRTEIASLAGTIPYEVLCSVGMRVPRVYLRGGIVVKVIDYLEHLDL